MKKQECLFCKFKDNLNHEHIVQDELVFAILDQNPVSPGHALVIPNRHVESLFDLTQDEILAVHNMLKKIKVTTIEPRFKPAAYNLGLNDGRAAGRTIDHCHFHLIPRYEGDVDNPRGGIRHIIPGKGNY
jgi:diadenosine tetraphosphate (Ap4A) HIT family hydrolase